MMMEERFESLNTQITWPQLALRSRHHHGVGKYGPLRTYSALQITQQVLARSKFDGKVAEGLHDERPIRRLSLCSPTSVRVELLKKIVIVGKSFRIVTK